MHNSKALESPESRQRRNNSINNLLVNLIFPTLILAALNTSSAYDNRLVVYKDSPANVYEK